MAEKLSPAHLCKKFCDAIKEENLTKVIKWN